MAYSLRKRPKINWKTVLKGAEVLQLLENVMSDDDEYLDFEDSGSNASVSSDECANLKR